MFCAIVPGTQMPFSSSPKRSETSCSPYPMWADADDMWQPTIPAELERHVFHAAFAIAYAENECVETRFPAHNPVPDVPELSVNNPMTPLHTDSFWSVRLRPYCDKGESDNSHRLIEAVDALFCEWKRRFKNRSELPTSRRQYSLDDQGLTVGAGIIQIVHYANETSDKSLVDLFIEVQRVLKSTKTEFFDLIVNGLGYFGIPKKPSVSVIPASSLPGASELMKASTKVD